MPKISVIVPVYNIEKYLRKCIDSILDQTFTDFELLLIDDGSADQSGQICEEFATKDSRIRVFHKTNGGVSSARNLGIDNATGEFMYFVDADDELPSNCLETHINLFSPDIDMTLGGFEVYSEEGTPYQSVAPRKKEIVTVEEALRDFTPNGELEWQRYLWNRMFRAKLIKKTRLRFNERLFYKEDGLFIVQYLTKCTGGIGYTDKNVYNYMRNTTSAMGRLASNCSEKLLTNVTAHCKIIREMKIAHIREDILGREIKHAFSSRNWVLSILLENNILTNKARYTTLVKIYLAIGPKETLRHFFKHFFE